MRDEETKRRYVLPPCASYDVDAMESWLSEKAEQGWLLCEDGFFAGFAAFQKSAAHSARYRLEAAQKSTSMWAGDGGEPDPEAVALAAECAWEYVGRRGEFYIYRTLEPGARELNTDPAVQALAVAAAEKRQWGNVLSVFFWVVFYIVLQARQGGFLLTAVTVGSGYFFFTAALVLCLIASNLAGVLALGRLKRRLRAGTGRKPPKPRPAAYFAKNFTFLILCAAWVCVTLCLWSVSALDEDKIPLEEYGKPLPFSTLTELAGGGAHDYAQTMTGIAFNHVTERADLLAPVVIGCAEHARVTRADGTVLDGALYVTYFEAKNEWIARGLALGLARCDRQRAGDSFEALAPPASDAGFIAFYHGQAHWPVLVVQKGSVVMRVELWDFQGGALPDFSPFL